MTGRSRVFRGSSCHNLRNFSLIASSALPSGSSAQIGKNIQYFGFWLILLSALAFAAVWISILTKGNSQQRILGIVLVLASVAVWGAAMQVNFAPYFDYANFDQDDWKDSFFPSRYSTVPSRTLLALLPLGTLCSQPKFGKFAATTMTALVILQAVYFFPAGAALINRPDWMAGVELARAA